MARNTEKESWSGKIKVLTRANGNMEKCTVRVSKRFLMARFMTAYIEIINLTGKVNAIIVTVTYKKVNSDKESTTAKVERPTMAYSASRFCNRYKI